MKVKRELVVGGIPTAAYIPISYFKSDAASILEN